MNTVQAVAASDALVVSRLVAGPLSTNVYVLACRETREAIIVDPADDAETLLACINDLGVQPVALIATHVHWDHVQAVDRLRSVLGVQLWAHPLERAVYRHEIGYLADNGHWDWAQAAHLRPLSAPAPRPGWNGVIDQTLTDGQSLSFGALALSVLHTPGHSPGSVSLHIGDCVLSGDTLFPGGPGLTGWPLSDFTTIMASLRRQLFALPDATRVLPGHGAATTLGAERPGLDEWEGRGW